MSTRIIQQNTHIIQEVLYDNNLFMTFGDWLKQQREERRISGIELSRLSGVSRQYISNLERNLKTDVAQMPIQPSAEKVESLAKALGADIDEARLAAGYAPIKTILPDELQGIPFAQMDDDDLQKMRSYAEFLIAQKK